jgi:hypothetical protein
MLTGYKTYIIAVLMFVSGGLRALQLIDEQTYMLAMSLLGPTGLITLRLGIKK